MLSIKVSANWKTSKNAYIKVNGDWKQAKQVYYKKNGEWKLIAGWENVTIANGYTHTYSVPAKKEWSNCAGVRLVTYGTLKYDIRYPSGVIFRQFDTRQERTDYINRYLVGDYVDNVRIN